VRRLRKIEKLKIRRGANGGLMERAIPFRSGESGDARIGGSEQGVDDSVLVNRGVKLDGWVELGTPH
jgi:hypothetical protein